MVGLFSAFDTASLVMSSSVVPRPPVTRTASTLERALFSASPISFGLSPMVFMA